VLVDTQAWADSPPDAVLHRGSGWGALERIARERGGDRSLNLPGTPFTDDSLGPRQAPWLELLETGRLPSTPADQPPAAYQTSSRWVPHLEAARGWLALLHLGVIRAAAGDITAAADAWTRSIAAEPNAVAWRNLAVLAQVDGDLPSAIDRYRQAHALAPDLAPLAAELLNALLAAGDGAGALTVIETVPAEQRALGRFRLAEVRAALLTGDLDRAAAGLEHAAVVPPDVREGEVALHEVWFDYQVALAARQEQRPADDELRSRVRATVPVPAYLDFRM
jgi:tetratricopeptide (TPR) repeat protein